LVAWIGTRSTVCLRLDGESDFCFRSQSSCPPNPEQTPSHVRWRDALHF
jgi:hypothetical protein